MGSEQASKAAQTYENYLGVAIAVPWTRLLLEYGTPRPGERVLDLACGTGNVARHVAPMVGADGKVTALDISPAMVDVARQLLPPAGAPIQWIEGDAVSLPFSDGAFDVVLCQQGLQFFSDRAAATREMRRVLLRRGRAVVSVWGSSASIHSIRRCLKPRRASSGYPSPLWPCLFLYGILKSCVRCSPTLAFRASRSHPARLKSTFLRPSVLCSSPCWGRRHRCPLLRVWARRRARPWSRPSLRRRTEWPSDIVTVTTLHFPCRRTSR